MVKLAMDLAAAKRWKGERQENPGIAPPSKCSGKQDWALKAGKGLCESEAPSSSLD